ncbi:MAG: virulence RhuM family protein [Candidatus Marinimicrobia bacterium]|nr:virulence RhuM family protein [Candidatus Neomarinimicrobiota bacterium]
MKVFLQKGQLPDIEVQLKEETVRLTQNQLAVLFNSSRINITEHIQLIFHEGELEIKATCRKFRLVRTEGKRQVKREIEHYNLDVVISISYRVKSKTATQFRIWATNILLEHLVKGYTINEKRLKAQAQIYQELQNSISVGLAYA